MKEYLFVYGQFRDTAKNLLKKPVFFGRATIKGKIYRVNEFYPGFVSGSGEVLGDIYLIDPSIFPELDDFEGDEYIRVKINTSKDIECWVYKYKYDVKDFEEIKGGDWWLR
jgi:gamma-glutamylcyclotransferase (GGCT)/AIG2-like uncharacterized protein YtfP